MVSLLFIYCTSQAPMQYVVGSRFKRVNTNSFKVKTGSQLESIQRFFEVFSSRVI